MSRLARGFQVSRLARGVQVSSFAKGVGVRRNLDLPGVLVSKHFYTQLNVSAVQKCLDMQVSSGKYCLSSKIPLNTSTNLGYPEVSRTVHSSPDTAVHVLPHLDILNMS